MYLLENDCFSYLTLPARIHFNEVGDKTVNRSGQRMITTFCTCSLGPAVTFMK